MKLRSTVKAKAFGRSGISEALWKDYILLRFPHIYWTIFFFMEHSVLAPMLTQTSLDKSPSAHRLLGDLLFLLLGMDSKGNAGMCKPGLSLRNHLWRLDYFLPSVCLFVCFLPWTSNDSYQRDPKEKAISIRKSPQPETDPLLSPDLRLDLSFLVTCCVILDKWPEISNL